MNICVKMTYSAVEKKPDGGGMGMGPIVFSVDPRAKGNVDGLVAMRLDSVFDSRTAKVQEWALRKYSTPYTVSVPDRNGHVYAPSNMSERVIRLNPKTGEVVEYLMPTQFDSKKISVHPRKDRTEIWMANTRNARLVKLEPLD